MGRRCKLLWRLGSNPGRMMCRLSWLSGISRWWTILDTTCLLLYLILDLISCYHPMPPILLTCLLWYTFDDAKGEDFSTYFWFIFLLHLLMYHIVMARVFWFVMLCSFDLLFLTWLMFLYLVMIRLSLFLTFISIWSCIYLILPQKMHLLRWSFYVAILDFVIINNGKIVNTRFC